MNYDSKSVISQPDISRPSSAEKALIESEKRFRDFAEAAADRFWETDTEFRYTYISHSWSQPGVLAVDEMIGKRRWELPGINADTNAWRAHQSALLAHRPIRDFEYVRTYDNGQRIWVRVRGKPIYDDEGAFVGYRGTDLDVTAEAEAQVTARKNDEMLFDAVGRLDVGFFLWDDDDLLIFANEFCKRLYPRAALKFLPGTPYEDIVQAVHNSGGFLADGMSTEEWIARQTIRHRETLDSVVRVTPDGRHISLRQQKLPNGRYLSLHIDVTEQVETKAALARSEGMLDRLVETTGEGYWNIDNAGVSVDLNPAMQKILGRGKSDVVGRSIFDFVDAANAEIFNEQIRRRQLGDAAPYEIALTRPDGSQISCINNAAPIFDENGDKIGSVGLWTDISSIKEAQEALRISKEAAEAADRAKSKFLAAASHDLRQPLQAMTLLVSALSSIEDNPKKLSIIEKTEKSVHALSELLDALLDVSKLEAGLIVADKREMAADELTALGEEFRIVAQERNLDLRIVPSSETIFTDPVLFKTILRNLLANALKYATTGRILFGCRRRGENLRIEVWDTGPGIPDETRDLIFEEFYQIGNDARDREKGFGLGLSIVRRVAHLLDHPIEMSSVVGKGTVFSVEVPIVRLEDKRATAAGAVEAPTTSVAGRIILIDDEPAILDSLTILLENLGYEVFPCRCGGPACADLDALAGQCGQAPDLIISDYRLPESMTGIEAIRKLRNDFSTEVPAVLLTGEISEHALVQARMHNFRMLHKPIQAELLRQIVAEEIAIHRPALVA